MLDLELGDGLVQILGTETEDLFDPTAPLVKKEEEDEILKDLMEEYGVEDIKKTMDKKVKFQKAFIFSMVEKVKHL